jgi:Protein of unknown function (DUF4245)
MTESRPTDQRPQSTPPGAAPSPAIERANRLSAANMLRSLLPLVVIILAIVGWQSFRQGPDENPVKPIDPSSTVQLAAARAGYPVVVPTGLPDGYRPTSARTDAGKAGEGDPVTLQIGYVTPSDQYAGFVVSDDPAADPLTAALNGAQEQGTVDVGGQTWTRSTTQRGETALSRTDAGVTVLVTGSAPEPELETVAGAVRPYSG